MTDDDLDDYEPDWWQEYKDDLAMGRIHRDGTYREPDIDWDGAR